MIKNKAAITSLLDLDTDKIKALEDSVAKETDAQIVDRLQGRFDILTDMTKAVRAGNIRAMIVTGPPGVGKSHGVAEVLERDDLFNVLGERKPKYEIVKGTTSSIGLYVKLHEFKDAKCVLVFDDCDDVLMDETSLDVLKSALDSSRRRWIAWNKDSRILRANGIPDRFEFCGAAIFITNIKFEMVRSKRLKTHLSALESRCHYIDLQLDTIREKLCWIKFIVEERGMLKYHELADGVQEELLKYVDDNQHRLRELSLRMVLKLADLHKSFPNTWKTLARTTCMR